MLRNDNAGKGGIEEKKERNTADKFYWGTSSAAFQIEGAFLEDGKGLSIWDVYLNDPGKHKSGENGNVACDHYHRFREDIRLMAELGVNAYRFSISWARILPEGTGRVNEEGIRFYRELIEEMKKYGIEPFVTLYHWDLPQKLFERGGWLNRDSADWFAEYAALVGERFGDCVKNFITLNEPSNVIEGLSGGGNAPAVSYSLHDRLTAVHHLLLAHGRAAAVLRRKVPGCKVGFAPCCLSYYPCDGSPEAERAAKEAFFAFKENDFFGLSLYASPVFQGDYPKEYYDCYKNVLPEIREGDLEIIAEKPDYVFANIYGGSALNGAGEKMQHTGAYNMLGWNVTPEVLYWGPKFLYEEYHRPVIISENGLPNPDVVCLDGRVHDHERIDFIARYTDALMKAKEDGTDVAGYFYWTFLDNLEWELGFMPRFGLVYVDFSTLQRIPKDSFYYYKELIGKKKV